MPTPDGWRETVVSPIPRVYYNRLLRPREPDRRALRALKGDPRVLLFNETNRWHRGMVLEMLAGSPSLHDHVPPSQPLTAAALPTLEEGLLYLAAPAAILPLLGPDTLLYCKAENAGPEVDVVLQQGGWERLDQGGSG